jgi:thymidine phosphorylase
MKTPDEEAHGLADLLVRPSGSMGIRTSAVINGMDSPPGSTVGNALEVRALAHFLRGNAVPQDLADEAGLVGTRLLKLKEEG